MNNFLNNFWKVRKKNKSKNQQKTEEAEVLNILLCKSKAKFIKKKLAI